MQGRMINYKLTKLSIGLRMTNTGSTHLKNNCLKNSRCVELMDELLGTTRIANDGRAKHKLAGISRTIARSQFKPNGGKESHQDKKRCVHSGFDMKHSSDEWGICEVQYQLSWRVEQNVHYMEKEDQYSLVRATDWVLIKTIVDQYPSALDMITNKGNKGTVENEDGGIGKEKSRRDKRRTKEGAEIGEERKEESSDK
ncbi:17361_t:CDS:2 [Funneliformis geosporum]|nr:17361_t:CDS:2 [Funneliformis geosporum]